MERLLQMTARFLVSVVLMKCSLIHQYLLARCRNNQASLAWQITLVIRTASLRGSSDTGEAKVPTTFQMQCITQSVTTKEALDRMN